MQVAMKIKSVVIHQQADAAEYPKKRLWGYGQGETKRNHQSPDYQMAEWLIKSGCDDAGKSVL
ncbi:hypothetical protein LNP74_15895 [Klebsiella pneumoniae subsp. pneumoniae]|nr:hypothetical protein [Klebsiella pneumoniae subsp. pneumoniae]